MEWKKDLNNTAPKTGEVFLRYNPLQNIFRLIKWNTIHRHWVEDKQWVNINEEDLWLKIPDPKGGK